jgi:putative acetyltransferase
MSANPVVVRPGGLDDARVIALLRAHLDWTQAQSPPESVHALDLDGLKVPEINFWSAWDGEELLGVGALKRLSADHGEVKSMHTAQKARRRGVASIILAQIIAAARDAGLRRLSLETGSMAMFEPARELYHRHGFRDCAPFGDYVEDPHSAFMTLELHSTE